jgi:hypothetical protein
MKSMGAKWIRFDLAWETVQPNDGDHYDWSRADTAIANITAHGLTALPILNTVPAWARASSSCHNKMCVPDTAQFARFAMAAASRYSAKGVHTWEIWNEPNLNDNWRPASDPAGYADLLKTAAPAIRAADATAFIVSAGLSSGGNDPVKFVQGMYKAGAKPYFDALGYHPYCWQSGPSCLNVAGSGWNKMMNTSPSLRSVMKGQKDGDKQIWITEFGAPIAGSNLALTEAQQAQQITDAYTYLSKQTWAGPVIIYTYVIASTDSNDTESWYGLVNTDYTHRPSYDAFKSSAQQVSK